MRGIAIGSLLLISGVVNADVSYRFHTIDLKTNDLAFEPVSGLVYATVPSTAGAGFGNTITSMDPITKSIQSSTFVGSEPNELSLSAGTQTFWTALDGAFAFRSFDASNLTAGTQYSVGTGRYGHVLEVDALAAVPGRTDAVAITRGWVGSSGQDGIALYVDGAALPLVAGGVYTASSIAFTQDGGKLLAYNGLTSGFDLSRINVRSDGLVEESSIGSVIGGYGTQIEMTDDILYATNGRVVDPYSLSALGSFAGRGALEVDPASGLSYMVDGRTLKIFDLETFVLLDAVSIPGMLGSADQVVLTGDGSLAFNTTGGQVYFVDTVPLPASFWLFGSAVFGLLGFSSRKN